jgi:hypothetical protein
MRRRLYSFLIRLHPKGFRDRFGDEMLGIYDDRAGENNRAWLFFDAIVSALRQRLLRGGSEGSGPAVRHSTDGVPLFATLDNSRPPLMALSHGSVATGLAWAALSLLMAGERNIRVARFEIAGVHSLANGRLQSAHAGMRDPASAAQLPRGGQQKTDVRAKEQSAKGTHTAQSVWLRMLSIVGIEPAPDVEEMAMRSGTNKRYALLQQPGTKGSGSSRPILLLPRLNVVSQVPDSLFQSLDRDLDTRLSVTEVAHASENLLSLDKNHDGRLTAAECGLAERSSVPVGQASLGSLVFAALDQDRDGQLSAREIADAAATLKALDRNHDGWVSREELQANN